MNNDYSYSFSDIKQGFTEEDGLFKCLFCDSQYETGDIYSFDGRLVEASKAILLHIKEEHISVFDELIKEDKKTTGLTNVQKELLTFFHSGLSDKEVSVKTNTSNSTVRIQRYNLREKAKQAKVFLAIYELMEEKAKEEVKLNIHSGATMVDERYSTSEDEAEKIIDTFFTSMNPLVLKSFSPKEKKKLVILRVIAEQFERVRRYTEKEVNDILKPIYEDYVTIKRYLIEYGFMDRTLDCKEYWLK